MPDLFDVFTMVKDLPSGTQKIMGAQELSKIPIISKLMNEALNPYSVRPCGLIDKQGLNISDTKQLSDHAVAAHFLSYINKKAHPFTGIETHKQLHWLYKVYQKSMKIGVERLIWKKHGNCTFPDFGMNLCDKDTVFEVANLDDNIKKEIEDGKWAAEIKYNGIRTLIKIENREHILSIDRNGKLVNIQNIDKRELDTICSRTKNDNIWLDCEVIGDVDPINKTINGHHTLVVFDIHFGDWPDADSSGSAYADSYVDRVRNINMTNLVHNAQLNYVRRTKPVVLKSCENLSNVYMEVLKNGHEGLILKKLDSKYIFGRNPGWIKLKPSEKK